MAAGAARTRDAAEFEAAFRVHAPAVRSFATHMVGDRLADDVVGETFLTVWRRWQDAPSGEALRAWTFQIARHEVMHARRTVLRASRLVERLRWHRHPAPVEPSDVIDDGGLTELLAPLSDLEREALLLVAIGGLRVQEAAELVGCSPGALSMRIARARLRLESLVRAQGAEDAGSAWAVAAK